MAPKIGVIIGSVRQPRIGDQVAHLVIQTIQKKSPATSGAGASPTLHLIDLASWNLPAVVSGPPARMIQDSSKYDDSVIQSWSREISSCDAFIFVSSEYNYSYPASLKQALDLLYYEWNGKPAMLITYGGGGGKKCAAKLRELLTEALEMRVVEGDVNLGFPSRVSFPLENT
jgi:NAD(P)H-dependent FMN reductase